MDCITVIVAVYNVERYVEKCLNSICNQSYKHLEIIVVDDGSTDGSGQICDRIAEKDSRIKVVHKENGGVSSARNVGLRLATGDYVTFVDGDDYIDENMYEKMFQCIASQETQMVICSFRYIYPTKAKEEKKTLSCVRASGRTFLKSMLKDAFGFYYSVVWNKLIRREVVEENNIWFDEHWNIMEDYRFMLQLIPFMDEVSVCKDALYNYRKDNNVTATNRSIPFEESYRNRKQGYLWLGECLEVCGEYNQFRNELGDYLIRYLASQYAKAFYAEDSAVRKREHKEIRQREFIVKELEKLSSWYTIRRKLYWSVKYLWGGMIQYLRKKIKKR